MLYSFKFYLPAHPYLDHPHLCLFNSTSTYISDHMTTQSSSLTNMLPFSYLITTTTRICLSFLSCFFFNFVSNLFLLLLVSLNKFCMFFFSLYSLSNCCRVCKLVFFCNCPNSILYFCNCPTLYYYYLYLYLHIVQAGKATFLFRDPL